MIQFKEAMIDLFLEVFKAYVLRKDERILLPGQPNRVVRGTSVSNSSVFENEMGLLLHKQLHDDYQILIDYPLTFPGRNNRITPDILVIRKNSIEMILELKIDLGYEKEGWEEKREERLNELKKYKIDTGYKPYNPDSKIKGKRIKLNVPDDVNYATVILCEKNAPVLIDQVIASCNDCQDEDRGGHPFFILLRDRHIHPNDFTTLDDAAVYIASMTEKHIHDWTIFEKYLRNRLDFRSK